MDSLFEFCFECMPIRAQFNVNQPYFFGSDIARALGYTKDQKAVKYLVEKDDKFVRTIETRRKTTKKVLINVYGVFSLIFHSKSPKAGEFRDFFANDILPSLRTHLVFDIVTEFDYVNRLETELKEERAMYSVLVNRNKELVCGVESLEAEVNSQKSKVKFANAIIGGGLSVKIGELAKIIARNGVIIDNDKLFGWMRENGYLGTNDECYNIPNRIFVEQGLFEVVSRMYNGKNGESIKVSTTKVTGKGQEYFVNGFLEGRFRL